MSLRRSLLFSGLAGLAHAALFVGLGFVRPPPAVQSARSSDARERTDTSHAGPSPREPFEVPLDLTDDLPAQSPRTAPEAPALPASALGGRGSPAHVGAAGAPIATRETRSPREEAREPEPASSAPEGASAPPDEGWSFSPAAPSDPTAPGVVGQATREVLREDTPRPAASAVGGLIEALDAHDSALGLGRGGPVLSALEAASRSMDVPVVGSATFDVAIDTSGRVSVALSDASSERAAWAKVAVAGGAAVDPSRVHIPPGARGWHVVIRIDARVQYPDGRRAADMGLRFEATPGKISEKSIVMESLPGFTISAQGKVCSVVLSVQLGVPVLAGGCSPENMGVPALRVVSGRILSEGRL